MQGSGVAGSFSRPTAGEEAPYSIIQGGTTGWLDIFVGSNQGNIGLTTLSGSILRAVSSSLNVVGASFLAPVGYINPADYFEDYIGSYAASGSVSLDDDNGSAFFQFTSVSISTSASAIPEPSTYAALLGFGAMGVVIWRRRRES